MPVVLLVLLLSALAACAPGTPEERVAKIRSGYTIELNSWKKVANEEAPAGEEGEPGGEEGEAMDEAEGETAEGEMAEGEMAEGEMAEGEMAAAPQPVDVLFDLVVYFRGRESLDGITVDISHADSAQAEKGVYRQYVEVPGMVNGETRQVDFVLEDLPLEDGDVFAVSVVPGVPENLGAYREFSESGP